jgi:hypothetical protein
MRWLLAWVIFATVVAVGLGSVNIPKFLGLVRFGMPTTAYIEDLAKRTHPGVLYEYEVDGRRYTIGNAQKAGNVPANRMKRQAQITYDRRDPHESTFEDPKAALKNEIISVTVAALMVPTFVLLRLKKKAVKAG